MDGIHVLHRDRRIARRRLAVLALGIAENALLDAGKILDIGKDIGIALAAEAVEPVLDVGGIARLRLFAIVDDIEARTRLRRNDITDGNADALGKCCIIDRLALLRARRSS
jgi:hypothetical protein